MFSLLFYETRFFVEYSSLLILRLLTLVQRRNAEDFLHTIESIQSREHAAKYRYQLTQLL